MHFSHYQETYERNFLFQIHEIITAFGYRIGQIETKLSRNNDENGQLLNHEAESNITINQSQHLSKSRKLLLEKSYGENS